MNVFIISVGKLKEKYLKDAIDEYSKRMKSYTNLEIIEVPDESAPENLSETEMEIVKQKEAERILSKIPKNSKVIPLVINAKQYDSVEFSNKISNYSIDGTKNLVFIIGGSLGLSKSVLDMADEYISFSKMTFPHQLMRLILVEQIYRAYRIMNNHPYHK